MAELEKGDRVELVLMVDEPDPVLPGTRGTVVAVDGGGTIHVDWDNGRHLGLIPGFDTFVAVK